MPIPYPGYTWQFTQHAIGLNPTNLFGLLKAAARFGGGVNPREEINRYLADSGVLTRNVRERGPDAWRDYQQILPELGLLYSTRVLREITLTPIAFALLDGLLGYSEVLTTQALRYQYPNGFKHDISDTLREELRGTRFQNAENLIELQLNAGVLVKPAVVILETLLSLNDVDPAQAYLTVAEIQSFLVEVYNFEQPRPDPRLIIGNRVRAQDRAQYGVRRTVQEWFKLLWRTDVFAKQGRDAIALSPAALSNRERINALLAYHNSPESYWVPRDGSNESRLKWFEHFGSVSLASQWVLLERDINPEYQSENYLAGRDDVAEVSATDDEAITTQLGGIGGQLRVPIERAPQEQDRLIEFAPPTAEELEARYTKTEKNRNLHAKMVSELAAVFRERGAEVYEDPNSIDLLVRIPRDGESIIEVKTVSPRNFKYRVRLAIGQLFEYQYRRLREANTNANLALAISSELQENNPVLDFLNRHLNISLLARQEEGTYRAFRATEGTPLDLLVQ